ncbi:hypothetical protein H696_00726 [Fonticula alba]|uniref:Uncharacterized protein n=1 Tax=Fonticula alba TaxID=691883 RepID=A0A058ZGX1_FONAL|nr:hypothetical protein H696_00726 [Fonticula alba]KCV73183.1 hypothetical protein H696_00726 [Fonticula alba]|eukprot:XP_009492884.1 hypothetical protein H696_00726 [Fonticula alba]
MAPGSKPGNEYQERLIQNLGTAAPRVVDAYAGDSGAGNASSYRDMLRASELAKREHAVLERITEKQRQQEEETLRRQSEQMRAAAAGARASSSAPSGLEETPIFTAAGPSSAFDETPVMTRQPEGSAFDAAGAGTARKRRWDETPSGVSGVPGVGEARPVRRRSRWDETPAPAGVGASKFDQPPMMPSSGGMVGGVPQTPSRLAAFLEEDLDSILPSEGYEILEPPADYVPLYTPSRKQMMTPTPAHTAGGFFISEDTRAALPVADMNVDGIELSQKDLGLFGVLLEPEAEQAEQAMTLQQAKERRLLRLLLRIKNGSSAMRKSAFRQITDRARDFGADLILDKLLIALSTGHLDPQERHLMVKVLNRVLYRLDELVRPHVRRILVAVLPMLTDTDDPYARLEAREVISNLSKAAGLSQMISTLRPDLDSQYEPIRNVTAQAFAIVAVSLGVPALLPFLRAVCPSKKSHFSRHTGIKIVEQIAVALGSAILPHLAVLVDTIKHGLGDSQQIVRMITALALGALAEAAAPYGGEAFAPVIQPLLESVQHLSGRALAAALRAIGFIIPLLDPAHTGAYAAQIMPVVVRQFAATSEHLRRVVLRVVRQCISTPGVEPSYVASHVAPPFFEHFWDNKIACDRQTARQLVETTAEVANCIGGAKVITSIMLSLKSDSEDFRRMTMEAIELIVTNLGLADLDEDREPTLIDCLLVAIQMPIREVSNPLTASNMDEHREERAHQAHYNTILNGFGVVLRALGTRCTPYMTRVVELISIRLGNRQPLVRKQAADLISQIADVLMECGEVRLLSDLGGIAFENLGEEYPDVLASLLGALKSIICVVGMDEMNPPIGDLFGRLVPIMRNRHDRVQENCIDLIGRIADRAAAKVSAKEWARVSFELLDLLRAHRLAVRRAAVSTFGYIATALGPQDVLSTLLNNLRVQERQNRVCTTVAIAIVAEKCGPYLVLPALMNEFRVPELNVRNGVLKSMSFLFEYIGVFGKDYVYATTELLSDALIDRDLVHRQTAASVLKHLALGVIGLDREDALQHLLNLLWPNIFETSPHVINAVLDSVDALRMALGPARILLYTLSGLFHPARKVRDVYWKIFNSTYIGSQDALVAAYPRLSDEFTSAASSMTRPERALVSADLVKPADFAASSFKQHQALLKQRRAQIAAGKTLEQITPAALKEHGPGTASGINTQEAAMFHTHRPVEHVPLRTYRRYELEMIF